LLLGAAGGGAQLATTPPHEWWPLGVVGAALLIAACRGARARVGALAGFGYGAALFVPLLDWLHGVGLNAWLGLAGSQALWLAGLGAVLAVVGRLPGWPAWCAALWVTEEWARGRVPFGGFTWGRLAFGQPHSPLTPYAALGGAPLLTFVVGLAGALLVALVVALFATLIAGRRVRLAAAAGAGVAVLFTLGLLVPVPTGGRPVTVAAVQGNVPRLGLEALAQKYAVLRNHVLVTAEFARAVAAGTRAAPDFVVWPENASDFDPLVDPVAGGLVRAAVAAIDRPVLVGAILDGPGPNHVRNAGIVWDPVTGPGASYVKRHLVPFGEYIPLRSLIGGWAGRFSLIPYDFAPGHRPGVLTVGPARVGDVICFEVTFDGPVRDVVVGGGQLLVVQTNDATFETPGSSGAGGESAQQLAVAQLRAVEHGRSVVVASTSGVSALIRPDGRIVARTAVFTPAVLDGRLPLRSSLTLADRLGPVPEYLLAGLGLLGIGAAILRRRVAA
jgi:apolipoprotein N-acyltransferase